LSRESQSPVVMGLAPYGRPSFLDSMRKIVSLVPDGGFELNLEFFRHHREDIPYQWMNGSPEFGDLFSGEHEGIIGNVLGRQILRAHHDLEWINLNRRRGCDTGLRV
jgi:hypothetical protein